MPKTQHCVRENLGLFDKPLLVVDGLNGLYNNEPTPAELYLA
jgi:hypothetical protein